MYGNGRRNKIMLDRARESIWLAAVGLRWACVSSSLACVAVMSALAFVGCCEPALAAVGLHWLFVGLCGPA